MQEVQKPLPVAMREKFAQLAELLQQASAVARDLSHTQPPLGLEIPSLNQPKRIPEDQAWFWNEAWQAGEREVNEALARGEYDEFDNIEEAIAALHQQV
jgi:hypothetical protein